MATQTAPVYANPAAPTYEELKARIAHLERVKDNEGSIVKRTVSGSLSMYGLSPKYPDTKTLTQWLIIEKQLPALKAYAKEHFDKLHFTNGEQRQAARKALGL